MSHARALVCAILVIGGLGCGTSSDETIADNMHGSKLWNQFEPDQWETAYSNNEFVLNHNPTKFEYGISVKGTPLIAYKFGNGSNKTLIFAGIHGDEPLSSALAERLISELERTFSTHNESTVVVIPRANPDGLSKGTRTNTRSVDLNRNFPAKNWTHKFSSDRYNPGSEPLSEPESMSLYLLVCTLKPQKIISVHCPYAVVNYDGKQSRRLADVMSSLNGLPVTPTLGYETPGSFGSWAGQDNKYVVVTLELKVESLEKAWQRHREALLAAIHFPIRTSADEAQDQTSRVVPE